MRKYISRVLLTASCAVLLASCEENSWNDEYLGGFETPDNTDVQIINYTLTDYDYKTIAANATNIALAGEDNAAALAAVGTQGYFTDVITAEEYIPALLSDPKFQYFTLDNGSSMKITYRTTSAPTEATLAAINAPKYKVTKADYQTVWGSETDYTESFAPSHTAVRSIPGLLKTAYPDAAKGDFVMVSYNTSNTDPVFSGSTEPDPEPEGFTLSSVIATAAVGDAVKINGYVSAITSQGFILTDASGSIFVYCRNTSFSELAIGSQIVLDGTVGCNNYGKQIADGSTFDVKGSQTVTYPAATAITGDYMNTFQTEIKNLYGADPNSPKTTVKIEPFYASITGTVKINGTNYNIEVAGAADSQGSFYGLTDEFKSQLTDGSTITVYGYFMAIAGRRYFNIATTSISTGSKAVAMAASRAVTVASESESALYTFDGTAWAVASDYVVLNHADYQAMGQKYDNLSGTSPAALLPIFLKQKYPYAQADDFKYVVYNYYDGSSTAARCGLATYNGSEWSVDTGVSTTTSQFVKKDGKWRYDPSVVITLPAGRNQPLSTLYFQTCVDWVKNNVPDGAAYISSYGNNEYYCGTSAYQGNVDLRPLSAKGQYAGYASMSDEEVVALEKSRFETEVFPAALSILHPDAAPVANVDVTYTINFSYYTGLSTVPATIIYNVVGPAQFEFVSCTWNEKEGE